MDIVINSVTAGYLALTATLIATWPRYKWVYWAQLACGATLLVLLIAGIYGA